MIISVMVFSIMKRSSLFIATILPSFIYGQINYTGSVVNKRNGEKIPFASVGLIKENTGINADEYGYFLLISNKNIAADTLIVSCVGFKTFKLPLNKQVNENLLIALDEKNSELGEVIITSGKYVTSTILNEFSNCGNSYVGSSGYQTQLAQHFQAPMRNSLLGNVKICRMHIPFLSPEKARFRIRIYDMDSITLGPGKDLCNQVIEVKSGEKNISIDMEKYKLRIPGRDFFVAIEWLKIPFNENRRKTKMADGRVIETITYRPSIGWTDNQGAKMEAWMLDYKGNWRPMFNSNNKTSVSISVECLTQKTPN